MIGRKTVAIIVAAGVGLLAGAGALYIYRQGALLPFETATESPAGTPALPGPNLSSPPQAAASPEPGQASKPKTETTGAVTPQAEPTAVPSFDVVVIEPDGEGVVAGRAAPGWQVSVESSGTKVAEAKADAQGEWSAVLEKPLPAGDHALSLKITSPDGTRALSSQERVRVEVGAATTAATAPQAAVPSTPSQVETAAVAPKTEQNFEPPNPAPDLAVAEPRATTRAISPGAAQSTAAAAPKLVFKTVDYRDTGSSSGSVSISGTSDPGATIKVYSDNELLATVRADRDGTWSVVADKALGTGQHNFRAERIDAATGAPSARATVAIERLVPKPAEVAATETKGPVSVAPVAGAESAVRTKDVYTVQRGDTLWAIAKRYFGSGLRYPTIFQDNREIIQDPDLIHPKQEVKVPTQ